MLTPLAEGKGIELSVEDDYARQPVMADPERIFQVMSNLIGNALKFTPQGGHVRVSVSERTDAYEFRVRDDGSGISAEQLPRLFDRYWKSGARSDGQRSWSLHRQGNRRSSRWENLGREQRR